MTTKNDTVKTGKEKEPGTTTDLKKAEPTYSERFTNMVIHEFTGNVGNIQLSAHQKRLIQNYFIATDIQLKVAEEKRLKKSENYRDPIPVTWNNVNMESLALNVVACAKIGLDPALPNHINMVPYKNNKTNKYDIGFIDGYRGKELKAKKYGYDVPDFVTVKLVYKDEKFTPIYKDNDNSFETYLHKPAEDPFNPGEIIGGYYYHAWKDFPEKNKLMYYNLHEIEKRKPQYASVEFWGGEKPVYGEDGKKTGQKEKVEGWFSEMCWKTLYRLAYGSITIDSEKIDENLLRLIENEKNLEFNREPDNMETLRENTKKEIENKGNAKAFNVQDVQFEEINKPQPLNNKPEPAQLLSNLGKQPENNEPQGPGY